MNTLFVISVLFCVYTYALYPLLIWWLARTKENPRITLESVRDWPAVSVVIAVHNEEANIREKLANLRELDYPKPLEFVIVSDGSTDGSNAFLESQSDISFFSYPEARGKPTALNVGVAQAKGEILVYMDARQRVSKNAVLELVKYFRLQEVGAVSGELVMTDGDGGESESIGLYWRYEKWIREAESRFFSTAGATGALYAARRADFRELEADTLLDDFETPVVTLRQGKRTLFEPKAVAYDKPSATSQDEFRRKSRTLAGNYQSFLRNLWLFNPAKNPIFLQFLSHKVFRLLVPYAMLIALVSSGLSNTPWVKFFYYLQLAFYLFGFVAIVSKRFSQFRLANFIKVFLQMNYAAVYGLVSFMRNKSSVRWKSS
ncbi:MAG: glycosyltransferase family 2 protein [Gammaproteobacteria bacterium]|nr:glycosyltransferase family 2 protein [Gammaproteobacteria bacterium]